MAESESATQQSILLLEYNGLPKVKVTVASNISLAKLKELAAEKFSISQPVILEYFDDDFDEWVAVDEDYQLPSKGKLRVTIAQTAAADDSDDVVKTPEWVPYCTEPVSEDPPEDAESGASKPGEVAGAWVQTSKVWSRRDVLFVYFLNPDVLQRWTCGGAAITSDHILRWAGVWNNTKSPDIPTFEKTGSPKKADIRIFFGNGRCWSKIGTDAKREDKSEPTINLSLNGLQSDFQRYLVIHEFGHALGLEHEHQRSDFWSLLKKHVDEDKMRADPRLKGSQPKMGKAAYNLDWYKKKAGGDMSDYDPESVMHYWFDVEWLRNKGHRSTDYIERDPHLSDKEKAVLKGIVTRNNSFAKEPSKLDLKYLQKAYKA